LPASSNIDQVVAWLEQFVADFDFTRPGVDQNLGRDIANVVVERIQDRSQQQLDPDGSPWPENSTKPSPWMPNGYKAWKEERYGWSQPGYRTGQMLGITALKGQTEIEQKKVTLRYGWGAQTHQSFAPTGYLSKQDEKRTDREKAEYAHTGGKHGIVRRFYAIGQGDAEAALEVGQGNLNDYIRETNSANGMMSA